MSIVLPNHLLIYLLFRLWTVVPLGFWWVKKTQNRKKPRALEHLKRSWAKERDRGLVDPTAFVHVVRYGWVSPRGTSQKAELRVCDNNESWPTINSFFTLCWLRMIILVYYDYSFFFQRLITYILQYLLIMSSHQPRSVVEWLGLIIP